jgi:hypothetical protein
MVFWYEGEDVGYYSPTPMAGRLGIYYLRTHTLSRELFLPFSDRIDLSEDSKTLNPQRKILRGCANSLTISANFFDISANFPSRAQTLGMTHILFDKSSAHKQVNKLIRVSQFFNHGRSIVQFGRYGERAEVCTAIKFKSHTLVHH